MDGKLKIHHSSFIIGKSRGFTLIELLVVIAIIGVLATLLIANFIGVRQRARDAQRKSDLRQIQSALELYRSDQGSYPTSLSACGKDLSGGTPAVTYMQKIPCDPLSSPYPPYTYLSTGTTYSIIGCLENSSDSQKDKDTASPCDQSYTLQNP